MFPLVPSRRVPRNYMEFDTSKTKSPYTELSIKLWIDTEAQKVYFAEAGNDVVELLSCLLSLPMSTIIKVLTKERKVGSIWNVHESVQELNTKFMLPNESKEHYLRPTVLEPSVLRPLQQLLDAPLHVNTSEFFTCEGISDPYNRIHVPCCGFFTAVDGTLCPHCCKPMNQILKHVRPNGFVVGVATYIIADDLCITPASTVASSIALLVKCGVKDLSTLQEKNVKIGKEEALEILRASLKSMTVLTDVFLRNKNVRCKKETAS